MKKIENSFAVTGFIGKDAEIRSFETASVARFSIAVSRADKTGEETSYVSAFMGIEAWRKNEALDSFDVLKKGELITVEGYFKPEEWTDSKSGEKRNRIVMVATKFYPAPEKEEEKPDQPKQKAVSKKKKASKLLKRPSAAFFWGCLQKSSGQQNTLPSLIQKKGECASLKVYRFRSLIITIHSVISETIKAYMKIIEILFRGQTNLITQQNHALFIDRCSQRGSTSRLYLQCHHIRSPSWIDIPNNFLIEYNQTNNIFIQNGNIINFAHHCYNINQFIIIKIQYHYK